MQLTQSPKFNRNYAAKIVEIKDFIKHPNPKCERLKCCTIDGYSIAVSIDTNPGTYVYFPIECAIDDRFLSANNLFRDKVKNVDKGQAGFFEDNCRVKIIKLQGYPSEGFITPITYLYNWLTLIGKNNEVVHKVIPGAEFDSVDGEILCRKYVPKTTYTPGQPKEGGKVRKKLNRVKKVIDTQFRFHYDTTLIKKCPSVIHPNDIISITAKVHGTSGISAYVLCERPKKWYEKVFEFLTRKEIDDTRYDYLWSSRSVVKNPYYNETTSGGFYGVDVWKYADDVIRPHLQKGMTAYYEIVGYLPNGSAIQKLGGKAFDYGFEPPKSVEEYKYGENFGVQIYRLTYTNPDGRVYEFSARQVQQWCTKEGLKPVEEYYYGYAKDLYPELSLTEHWNENFLQRLASDKNFFMECESPTCNNKVPHEGIVIKIENSLSEAYKLKCIKFLEGESKSLDKGEVDIETES
jgi:hypothetical protein|nr:MAG TPA: hypothetical protein [Caudoviricetes sp.]